MTQMQPEGRDDSSHEELTGTLLAVVESLSRRTADKASIQRVIDRASQIEAAFRSGASGSRQPARYAARHASAIDRRRHVAASWAAAAAAVACLAFGFWLIAGNRAAFAQVQDQLAKVRTIQFVFRSAGSAEKPLGRVIVVEPDRYREELPDGRVIVTDLERRQAMQLDVQKKSGEIYPLYDATNRQRRVSELISILRNAPRESVESLGRRQIDGKDVIEYRIADERARMTLRVSVDGATNLPQRIEQSSSGDARATVVATDFVFDQPVDEALVRIKAPDGFQVTQVKSAAPHDDATLVVSSAGLGPVTWGMKSAEVIKLLGEPDGVKPFEVPLSAIVDGKKKAIGKKTGDELIYDSRGFRIVVAADGGVESINCYGAGQLGGRSRAFAGMADKDIRLGAAPEEVLKAYGEPDRRVGLTDEMPNGGLSYAKIGTAFSFRDGRLSHVQALGPQLRPDERGILIISLEEKP